MPAVEALRGRFRSAHTQVLGISVDSIYSHANWGKDLGGVSLPLLADFQPKGAVARSYGLYLEDKGITDRATVVIDRSGVIRSSVSVTPSGVRDIGELADECLKLDRDQEGFAEMSKGQPIPSGTVLFVKSKCGLSRKTTLALHNLHLRDRILVKNVSNDAKAAEELQRTGGKNQAPCLLISGEAMYEADAIVKSLLDRVAPI